MGSNSKSVPRKGLAYYFGSGRNNNNSSSSSQTSEKTSGLFSATTVQLSKPQNWDGAKPRSGNYLCLWGCGQRIPNSEKIIHDQHCPAKRLRFKVKKEINEMSLGNNPETSRVLPDTECWDEDCSESPHESRMRTQEQRRIKQGKQFVRELRQTKKVDLVTDLMRRLRKGIDDV